MKKRNEYKSLVCSIVFFSEDVVRTSGGAGGFGGEEEVFG